MRRSTSRILVSHAGTLPRPESFNDVYVAREQRRDEFLQALPAAVKEVVRQQAETGIDIVNDGELSKLNFSHYARERLGGLETSSAMTELNSARNITARD